MATLARRTLKFCLFIMLSMMIGRIFDIYSLVSIDTAIGLSHKLFDEGGQENVEAAYALIDAIFILCITTIIYLLFIKIFRYFIKLCIFRKKNFMCK